MFSFWKPRSACFEKWSCLLIKNRQISKPTATVNCETESTLVAKLPPRLTYPPFRYFSKLNFIKPHCGIIVFMSMIELIVKMKNRNGVGWNNNPMLIVLSNNWLAKGKKYDNNINDIAIAINTPINDSDRKYLKIFEKAAPYVFLIPIHFICDWCWAME